MKTLKGIGGSKGYAAGTAVVKRGGSEAPERYAAADHAAEEDRFKRAQAACEAHFAELEERAARDIGAAEAEIFSAYRMILGDDAFFKKALDRAKSESINIEYAIYEECRDVLAMFESMDDQYLRERAADIENVCRELIGCLSGTGGDFAVEAGSVNDVIVVAEDLTPAETVKLDKARIRGFVTERGGVTSHTVILAKALGIPALVGVRGIIGELAGKETLIVDAYAGTVGINPDAATLSEFMENCEREKKLQAEYALSAGKPALTLDGFHIDVLVNTGDADSIKAFDAQKCDGVGLFRTEFVYMGRADYPDEDAQYEVYGDIARRASGKEVIIRTLDIGGDKQLSYMGIPKEDNPFLGYRAIRLCLDRPEVFQAQLRAILRASAHGGVKIMFPMIVTLEELRRAKECVERAKQSLRGDGLPFNEDIAVGIMVETPAAAFLADQLAKEADFFSIGSNDLIQYVTATDRMNERVQYLYDSCNLSVLRAIRMVAASAVSAGIPWGICGEVASDELLLSVWVALGVTELSMTPSQVGKIKRLIGRVDKAKITPEIERVFEMRSIAEVKEFLGGLLRKLNEAE
ncbi:MAG: phosphoenolpyruvate--protein phosphotransferase [Synergistaceae bacterium]|jgi:phosphotransferase system enzyme I (PtsI)|nr:phosphoenolpyruvate--protein phosphotransferase [Synergistaceae bacterium]